MRKLCVLLEVSDFEGAVELRYVAGVYSSKEEMKARTNVEWEGDDSFGVGKHGLRYEMELWELDKEATEL
jgi:hypothetical protein